MSKQVTEAKRRAIRRYDAANTRQIHLKLNTKTDADILETLDSVENVQGYIKDLIRKDKGGFTMTIKELAQNWIENADTTPERITVDQAAEYIGWMDKDSLPEGLTPEAFAAAWNDIVG